MDNMPSPAPLPAPYRERLLAHLQTEPESVSHETVETLRSFCAESPEVEAGYICAVEVEREGKDPERKRRFCVKLSVPIVKAGDGGDAPRLLAQQLAESHPELMKELGCGVLADGAVPAWEKHAFRIFSR
jgi:hypothetical protein